MAAESAADAAAMATTDEDAYMAEDVADNADDPTAASNNAHTDTVCAQLHNSLSCSD